jgi:hypothetical protein
MSREDGAEVWRRSFGPGVVVLGLATVGIAAVSRWPLAVALVIGLAGIAVGLVVRTRPSELARTAAPVPVVVAIGALAARSTLGPVPELLAGATAIALVVWLADDPLRPPAGVRRAGWAWAIPALTVAIAWSSTALLPSSAAPIGVAGAVLVVALVGLAYLARRPELFARERTPTL